MSESKPQRGDKSSPTEETQQVPPNLYQQVGNGASFFLSPQAIAVALATAAQQVAQQIQVTALPNAQGSSVFESNNGNTHLKSEDNNSSTESINQHAPTPSTVIGNNNDIMMPSLSDKSTSFPGSQQQMALNSQVAALLASGMNPSARLNSDSTPNTEPKQTGAAAQNFVSFLQQQKQQQNLTNETLQSNALPNASSLNNINLMRRLDHANVSSMLNRRNEGDVNAKNGNSHDSQSGRSILSGQSAPAQIVHQHGKVNNAYAAASKSPIFFSQMQSWKLDQLEAYCALLRETHQPIPQPVTLLLNEARRREEKRTAKRVANRKSACTSRARKKAFVEEMTKANARLKRQAVILSLLPDLVMAIKLDGEITFSSAQVGRVLRQDADNLVGTSINDILVPTSRKDLAQLIDKLVAAEKAALDECKEGDESGGSSNSANNSSAAVVSEQSDQGFPPLSIVKVNSMKNEMHRDDVTGESVTANNAGARLSSLQHKPEGNQDTTTSSNQINRDDRKLANFENQEDVSSSTSTDSLLAGVEDMRKNRAGNENVSDDSGYRQSVESGSRGDSSSSTDISNNGGRRQRPMAPTCNICLIRDDFSTLWCEVTSSIRTRSLKEEKTEPTNGSATSDKKVGNSGEAIHENGSEEEQVKELLLCLRPIRDGKKIEGKLPLPKCQKEGLSKNDNVPQKRVNDGSINRPMKKRLMSQSDDTTSSENKTLGVKSGSEAEKSVVESLILMSSHKS